MQYEEFVNRARDTADVDDFLRSLADQEGLGCTLEQAHEHARTVLSTLTRMISAGELDNLRSQLPPGYKPLFDQPSKR
ncbi:MAG: DUF2267 domain-containing protein [Streptosporangiales bacterium]